MSRTIEPIVPLGQELIVLDESTTMEPMVPTRKELTYKEFAKRLHKACDHRGLPVGRGRATDLGKLVGVGYKGASKWLNGDGMPDMGHATGLAVELGVNFEWLMTGRGDMTGQISQGEGTLSQEAIAVGKKFDCLKSGENRSHVQAAIDAFTSAERVKKKTG